MKRGCALSLGYEYANPALFFFLSFHLVLSVRTHLTGSIVFLRVGHRTRREGSSNSSPHEAAGSVLRIQQTARKHQNANPSDLRKKIEWTT